VCGIVGFCDFNSSSSKDLLIAMTNQIDYRGPDSSGYFFDERIGYSIGLGHRRLSILDLSVLGSQPMKFEHLHIVLNGEIYNFEEIKKDLQFFGYKFVSNSDTEVVLASFHKWGISCVSRFIGMFVFCIYDSNREELYIIRDRAGVKPLYYSFMDNIFIFASELKSMTIHPRFKKKICRKALSNYFINGYISQPLSIYQDTFKLKSSNYLKLNLKSKVIEEIQYWNVLDFYNKPKISLNEVEVRNELEKILISACNYRMISDVPVGVFLSGGYDSTLVSALVQSQQSKKLNTYTIGFEDMRYNEANYAKEIASHIGTNHHEYYCSTNDLRAIFPKLSFIFDEPFCDSSAIPTYLVSLNAKKDVTVALSADGGDEIFGGYNSYEIANYYFEFFGNFSPILKKMLLLSLNDFNRSIITSIFKKSYNLETRLQKIMEFLKVDKSFEEVFNVFSSINTPKEVESLLVGGSAFNFLEMNLNQKIQKSSVYDHLMAFDYQTYMVDDILTKVDRTTMAVSLEGREPLLDHRIIEFMAQVPSSLKIKNGEKKYFLKTITHDYVPKHLLDRPKKGFGVPIFEWLKDDISDYINEYLNENKIKEQGILNWQEVSSLVERYKKGSKINGEKIWLILNFQIWFDRWMG